MLILSLSLNTEIASNSCTLKTNTHTGIWQKHTCILMCQVLEASLWVAQVQIKYKYTGHKRFTYHLNILFVCPIEPTSLYMHDCIIQSRNPTTREEEGGSKRRVTPVHNSCCQSAKNGNLLQLNYQREGTLLCLPGNYRLPKDFASLRKRG